MRTESLRIGQVAERAGVHVETLRYYERRGLLAEPARTPAGYRAYDPGAVERVRFIRGAQQLGFSLREIEALLRLQADPRGACADGLRIAHERVAEIEQRIAELRAMQRSLQELLQACPGSDSVHACPARHLEPPEPGPSTHAEEEP